MSESVPGSKKLDIPEYQVWVVESAHHQMVNDVSDDQDLQIDVSPIIAARSGGKLRRDILNNDLNVVYLLNSEHAKQASEWKAKNNPAYSVCHGAMYNVKWNVNRKPERVPAYDTCKQLHKSMPVAVGTTPSDSLLEFVGAHQMSEDDNTIQRSCRLLRADDLLYSYNYDAASRGKHYHVLGQQILSSRPSNQATLLSRHLHISPRAIPLGIIGPSAAPTASEEEKEKVAKGGHLKDLITNKVIDFSSARSHDWLHALNIRLDIDLTIWGIPDTNPLDKIVQDVGLLKSPSLIQETAKVLVKEFILLQSNADGSKVVPTGTLKPLYDDNAEIGYNARRDELEDTQPFFPLFLECEAEYAHIAYSLWSLEERATSPQGSALLSVSLAKLPTPSIKHPTIEYTIGVGNIAKKFDRAFD
ncbi:hypothetical protein BDR22DRAFT_889268 [Usnea florida]